MRWGKNDPRVLEESLVASLQETKRLKHLVQDLLAVSQAEELLADLENKKIWPVPIIEQAVQNMVLIRPSPQTQAETLVALTWNQESVIFPDSVKKVFARRELFLHPYCLIVCNSKKEEKTMLYDNTLLFMINGLAGHSAWVDKIIMILSEYGPVVFGLYLIGLWFSGNSISEVTENRKRALYAFFAAMLAMGMNQVISHVWYRNRPYLDQPVTRLLQGAQDASFPSDHAAGAFSIAGSLFGRTAGSNLLMAFAILVALSRVYVGLHYPSDILGGMMTGLVSSWLIERNKGLLDKPVALLLAIWTIIEKKLRLPVPTWANNR